MISLDSGDKIRGDASAATVVDYTISGLDANVIKQLADGQLASSIGDLFTADSADVVTSIILVNTDSSARTVNLYLTPNGGTARRLIPKNTSLGVSYCLITDGNKIGVYDASGNLQQTVTIVAHDIGGASHGADTLANLNSKISDATLVDTGSITLKALFDANTILAATSDNTPAAITIAEQRLVGRITSGNITALTAAQGMALLSASATADFNMPNNQGITYGDAGEKIEGDGTDLTISSSNLLNLTATTDVVIPVNIGLHFGDGAEKIESNNTDFTINSGGELNLTASSDVVIPVNIGLHFGDGAEKIESNNTDLTINSGVDINLTATTDINVPANVGMTFGDDGEKIEGNATDLTIASSNLLNLSATTDVVIPVNVGLHLGDGAEKLESNNTDLTINSGGDIALTATNDVNIPSGVGVTFGDDGEKIEGNGTDLTIASSNILNINAPGHILPAENTGYQLDSALSADGKYSGIIEAGTAGATLTFGEVCYFKASDSEWYEARADATVTSGAVKLGICVVAGTNGNPCTMLRYGKIRADAIFPTLTISAPVFISAATAGLLTSTAPTGTTNFVVRIVGHANTGDEIAFEPDNTYIELA